jgi:hypothetical protein
MLANNWFPESVALLVAATAKISIRDAMDGDPEAAEFLDCCIPEWRRHYKPPATRSAAPGGVTNGSGACWCGQAFTPKRKGQKFCSDSCRQLFHRKGM